MTTAARRRFGSWTTGQPVELDFVRAMTDVTMDIIAQTMFGTDLGAETAELGRAVAILSEVANAGSNLVAPTPGWIIPGLGAGLLGPRGGGLSADHP
jgi:cytochrome P450